MAPRFIRTLNKWQRRLLSAAIILFVAMLLFPPFRFVTYQGLVMNLGYGFLLSAPLVSSPFYGEVNLPLLLTQWFALIVVTGVLFYLLRDEKKDPEVIAEPMRQTNTAPPAYGSAVDGTSGTAPEAVAPQSAQPNFSASIDIPGTAPPTIPATEAGIDVPRVELHLPRSSRVSVWLKYLWVVLLLLSVIAGSEGEDLEFGVGLVAGRVTYGSIAVFVWWFLRRPWRKNSWLWFDWFNAISTSSIGLGLLYVATHQYVQTLNVGHALLHLGGMAVGLYVAHGWYAQLRWDGR